MKAWITYTISDTAFAERFTSELENNGIEFQDLEHEILPGDNIIDSIYKSISESEVVFVILSKESSNKKWFSTEIGILISEIRTNPTKRVIPILIDRGAEIPTFINQFKSVDFSDETKFTEKINLILKSLAVRKKFDEDIESYEKQHYQFIKSQEYLLLQEKLKYDKGFNEKQRIMYFITALTVILAFITFFIFLLSNESFLESGSKRFFTTLLALSIGMFLGGLISILFNRMKN